MIFKFELDLSPLYAWFNMAPQKIKPAIEKALYGHNLVVMAKSQDIVPIGGPPTSPYDPAPGTLRLSGTVLLPKWDGNLCSCILGYGGDASAYAIVQHENLLFRHKDGQQAKYLEIPFDYETSNLLGRVADAIQAGA